MSTIASPRDPSTSLRRLNSSGTPTSSGRPSLDIQSIRSGVTSPVHPSSSSQHPPPPTAGNPTSKRSNRAALREYYNLRAPRIEIPESEVPVGDLDTSDFDADSFVAKAVAENSLEDLLKLYTRVLGEVRALDAEKKALVYDNYSKLITATETIKKMRANMDPLNPMASTLDPAIAQIYSQASSIRETLRETVPPPDSEQGRQREAAVRKQKSRELAREALATPARLRHLVKEGKLEEARRQWEMPRRLLVAWKQRGVGGDEDVQACLDEGDAAVSRPPSAPAGDGTASARVSRDSRS